MNLRTEHLARCLLTLEKSLEQLQRAPVESIDYEIYRNAIVKGFELTLETSGKILRKAIKTFTGNPRAIDELTFKDVFRQAAKHGLLDSAAVERWFAYRDNRNSTAHDYGQGFAEETLALLPDFLSDARRLETSLREKFGHAET
ncbi:MAG TPA: nucleotidyltransferase substrate binding protein [Candidatus Cybelea sp.]|jgi:nucleotidyltransferase substrate binding protein (TIGR01987 family)|nr:nucleotidyltransferase substrate binding protein [Candidatus Cybelea sp.]